MKIYFIFYEVYKETGNNITVYFIILLMYNKKEEKIQHKN